MFRLLIPVALLGLTLGCETPASPTTVTTIVTLPTAPTTVPVTTPVTTPTPTCPTATCGGTGTTPTVPIGRTPEILNFTADNPRVHDGGATILRWEISDPTAIVRIDPGVGSVGTVGFLLVSPTRTTTYTITARNSIATVQRTLTVVVVTPEA